MVRPWNGGEEEGKECAGPCSRGVLRLLGTNCDSQRASLVHQVKEHSLRPTESSVSCGHFPCPCLATFLFCFINEYKVSFHRQPLKQNAWLLFQRKFLQKPHLTEPTHTHVLLYGFLSCSNVWEIANERWVIQRPEITAERLGLEFGQ